MSEQITLDQVQEFIQNTPEALETLAPNFFQPERVQTFLSTDEGSKLIQPIKDKAVSQGINTWKANNLQREIDEALAKANPDDTPEQKRIRSMELEMQKFKDDAIFAQQKATALSLASEKNLPTGLIDHFVGKTDTETREKMNKYETEFKSAVQLAVEAKLGGGTYKAPHNQDAHSQKGAGEKKFSEMSYEERTTLYQSNPAEYNRIKQQG